LEAEVFAVQAGDTPQRNYRVFKVRARCVEKFQHIV